MIETHCHLDYLKAHPLEEILRLSSEAGVSKLVTISVDPGNLDAVIRLSEAHAQIWCTQGIHPHDAKECTEEVFAKIKAQASHRKVVAIGEIGLDFHYNNSPADVQEVWFRRFLELAGELNKPVVIHSRDADLLMAKFLIEFSPKLQRKGVVHSFSSGLELAQTAIDQGFYLGFNGMITFPKADNVREALKLCPLEQLLIETDSPFLTPVPHRGKENGPYFLPFVLQKMAEIKGVPADKLSEILAANAQRLFQF
jgi:TatD DNase family protein